MQYDLCIALNLCTALNIIKDCIEEPKMIDLYIRLSKESRICDKNTGIVTIKKQNNDLCIVLIILMLGINLFGII